MDLKSFLTFIIGVCLTGLVVMNSKQRKLRKESESAYRWRSER